MATPEQQCNEVVNAFLSAITAGDEDAAKATSAVWDHTGDAPRRFYSQLAGAPLKLEQTAPARVHEGRAAAPIQIVPPDGNTQQVWLLLTEQEGWKVAAIAASWSLAGLYVHGRIELPPSFAELPESEAAADWARRWIDGQDVPVSNARALDVFEELRETHVAGFDRTAELPGSDRVAVRLTFALEGDVQSVWAILGTNDKGLLTLIARSWVGSVGSLLAGIDPAWPITQESREGRRYTEAEAKSMLEQAVQDALRDRGASEDDLGARMAGILSELFTSALDEGGDVVDLEAERRKRTGEARTRTTTEQRLQGAIEEVLNQFLRSDKIDGDLNADDLRIDSKFVKEQGPALMGGLFGALFQTVVPDDLTVDMPAGQDDQGQAVSVKLDLGDLFRGLLAPEGDADR